MRTSLYFIILAGCLLANRVYPYSHDGHYLVGAIADQMLAGTPTAAKIQALIGNVTLATASTLADEIKNKDPNHPFTVTTNVALNSDLEAFLAANEDAANCSEPAQKAYH